MFSKVAFKFVAVRDAVIRVVAHDSGVGAPKQNVCFEQPRVVQAHEVGEHRVEHFDFAGLNVFGRRFRDHAQGGRLFAQAKTIGALARILLEKLAARQATRVRSYINQWFEPSMLLSEPGSSVSVVLLPSPRVLFGG